MFWTRLLAAAESLRVSSSAGSTLSAGRSILGKDTSQTHRIVTDRSPSHPSCVGHSRRSKWTLGWSAGYWHFVIPERDTKYPSGHGPAGTRTLETRRLTAVDFCRSLSAFNAFSCSVCAYAVHTVVGAEALALCTSNRHRITRLTL